MFHNFDVTNISSLKNDENLIKEMYKKLRYLYFATRGPDEVIAKSAIWLKLYQMNIWNPSRKDKKSFFQNMN